jgi:putative flippase GtrA
MRLRELIASQGAGPQGVRFLIAGAANTFVGYGTYALCLFLGAHYVVASIAGQVVGMTNSYILNRFFTFRSKGRPAGEIPRFVAVYGLSYALNLALLYVMIDGMSVNAYGAGLVTLVVTTATSFVGHRAFSFKERKTGEERR